LAETGAEVDDILCEFSDDTSMDLQGKNRCGFDAELRSAVQQWINAATSTAGQPSGGVALVVGQARGDLVH
jgi:hypothetical protein